MLRRGGHGVSRRADYLAAEIEDIAAYVQTACHTPCFRPYTNTDVIAACSSTLSRNHSFGACLGRDLTVEQARAAATQTAEGVASCKAVQVLAERHAVDMPLHRPWSTSSTAARTPGGVRGAGGGLPGRLDHPEDLVHRGLRVGRLTGQ